MRKEALRLVPVMMLVFCIAPVAGNATDDGVVYVVDPVLENRRIAGPYSIFNSGRALVSNYTDCKWGYIDTNGNLIIPYVYDMGDPFSDGFAAVKKDVKYGFIDKNGNEVVPPIYDFAEPFSEGFGANVEWNGEIQTVEITN